jgi:hypothetical protein
VPAHAGRWHAVVGWIGVHSGPLVSAQVSLVSQPVAAPACTTDMPFQIRPRVGRRVANADDAYHILQEPTHGRQIEAQACILGLQA